MLTAVDTCVISEIWSGQSLCREALAALRSARTRGEVVICGIVFAELIAHPAISPEAAMEFFDEARIRVDAEMPLEVWKEAGLRNRRYQGRRRKAGSREAKRPLADFFIGAHALLRADSLLTLNVDDFRRDFPELVIARV